MPVKRRASPLNARQVWIAIRHLSQTKQSSDKVKICKFLQKEFKHTLDESENILKLLLEDNLLIVSTNSNSRSKKINGYQTYKIPLLNDNDNLPNDYDWYCYDCHLGGDVIECKSCLRVFHENCNTSTQSMTKQIVNVDSQNTNNNSAENDVQPTTLNDFTVQDLNQPLQPIQFEENVNNILISNENQRNITTDSLNNDCKLFDKNSLINSNTNVDNKDDEPDELKNIINIDEAKDNLLNTNNIEFKKEERFSTDGFIYDENQQEKQLNLNELEHSIIKTTIDSKDVLFSGVLRQPNQRLLRNINNTSNIKLENLNDQNNYNNNNNNNDINNYNDNKLCTICKLMKNTELTEPPNTSTNEINYLLHFTYNRIKTWIPEDTFSPLELPFGKNEKLKDDIDFCKRKLIKSLKTMADIKKNLKSNFYTKLEDFHTDILDIQHCLGVLYGVQSQEYEAIKYLIKDCVYELSEIKQCRDCYRHSNEMSGQFWFSKPCVLRHELVFAKQIGYNYWPAKVIKFSQNQYDVRFFGQKHSRAVIDAQFVKPIDLDLKQLKIKKTSGFVKAMEELQKHQELLLLPSGTFSYDSNNCCNSIVDFYNDVSNEFENEKQHNLCDKNLITTNNSIIMTTNLSTSNNNNNNRKSKIKRNTKRTTLRRRKSPAKRKTLVNNRADETSLFSPTVTTTDNNISRRINNNNNNSNLKNNNYNNNFNNITNNNNNNKKLISNIQQQYNNIMNEQITNMDDISLQSLNSSQNSSTIATVVNKRKRNENFSHLFVEENSNADNSSGESTISDYIIRKNKNKKRIIKRKTQSEGDTGGDHNSKRSKKLTKKDNVDKESVKVQQQVHLDELHEQNNKDAQQVQQEQPFLNLMNNDKNISIEKTTPLTFCAGTTSNNSTSGVARIKANIIDRKWDVVEGLSRSLSTIDNISDANKLSLDTLQEEIKRWQTKISLLKEEHKKTISIVKKQQWCHTCEELANYYCCWLASYCSVQCQKQEWNDHKLLCKNKSNINNKEENYKEENQNKKDDNTDINNKCVYN